QAAAKDFGQRIVRRLAEGVGLGQIPALDGADHAVLEHLGLGQHVPQRVDALADDSQPGDRPQQEERQDHPLVVDQIGNGFPGHGCDPKRARRKSLCPVFVHIVYNARMAQATQGSGEFHLSRKISAAELLLGEIEVAVCALSLVLCARNLPDPWLWAKVLVPVLLAAWSASLFRLVDLLRSLSEQLAILQRGEKARALNTDGARRALAFAPRESALVH